jgi:outer membrane protein insertion porin family
VIRREFKLAEGDPFNRREIQEAADRIRATGYFETVNVEAREGSSQSQAIIDVNVVEQPTGNLGFGASYNGTDGIAGNITLEENNFLGRGQTLRASFSNAARSREIQLGFEEPAFLGRDLLFGIDISQRTTNSSGLPIAVNSISFSPKIGFPVSENGRVTLFYRYSRDLITQQTQDDGTGTGNTVPVAASALTLQDIAAGRTNSSRIGLTYTLDRRNSPTAPTDGFRFTTTAELVGLGGHHQFAKLSALYKVYASLPDERFIFSAELEAGAIQGLGSHTRVIDRFFLGGDRLRGFQDFGIGPRDQSTLDPVGGNFFAAARFEATFPIGIPEEYGIFGGVFFDVGSVWGLSQTAGANFATEDTAPKIRSAIGVSLFWETPIGPLRFNFARPLQRQSYDRPELFRFTIDARF